MHALVLVLAARLSFTPGPPPVRPAEAPADAPAVVWLRPVTPAAELPPPAPPPATRPAPALPMPARVVPLPPPAVEARRQAAPPAPTAEEWAFASRYTLKNAKAYRHTWGQQVRSMMGTAVEGADAGWVRFRVEIAPDGRLAQLATLWATSEAAERLARRAIEAMPAWPPTPSGQPLVFERTIAFTPFASDVPPLYKDDCLPDPPAYRNPFAWDGRSAPAATAALPAAEPPDPEALADCLRQRPQDSIEAESAHDQRELERWASPRLGR